MILNQPKRCYIREEWYNAISCNSADDRLEIYEAILQYTYFGQVPKKLSQINKGMFSLIRSAIDFDRAQYDAKCATNRQNGSKGGRPRLDASRADTEAVRETEKPKKTDQNPSEPKKPNAPLLQYKTNTTTKQNIPLSVFNGDGELLDAEKDKVFLNFWSHGVVNPELELERMCDYYTARGWVDKGGNPITSPASLANVWKAEDTAKAVVPLRKEFAQLLRKLQPLNRNACRWFDHLERPQTGHVVVVMNDRALMEYMEDPANLPTVRKWINSLGCQTLGYLLK